MVALLHPLRLPIILSATPPNNILVLLGIRFEELFDENNLPGIAETSVADIETPETGENSKNDSLLLKEINTKLDIIIDKYAGKRKRKTYMDRFADLSQYMFLFQQFSTSYFEPEKNGFSKRVEKRYQENNFTQEIYGHSFWFVSYFMNNLNKRNKICKLFEDFQYVVPANLESRRLLVPFFMMGMLEQLIINLIISGIKNNRPVFRIRIREENFTDWFNSCFQPKTCDDQILLGKLKNTHAKTRDFIKHALDNKIMPSNDFCVKCEVFFVRFFKNTFSLFQTDVSINTKLQDIFANHSNINEMEKRLKESLIPGFFFSFDVRKEQLGYLEEYVDKIEEIQIELGRYYAGNVDMGNADIRQSGTAKIGYTPS